MLGEDGHVLNCLPNPTYICYTIRCRWLNNNNEGIEREVHSDSDHFSSKLITKLVGPLIKINYISVSMTLKGPKPMKMEVKL